MTPDQFCYWLRGYFELSGEKALTPQQVDMIKKHLDLLYIDITDKCPDLGPLNSFGIEEPEETKCAEDNTGTKMFC